MWGVARGSGSSLGWSSVSLTSSPSSSSGPGLPCSNRRRRTPSHPESHRPALAGPSRLSRRLPLPRLAPDPLHSAGRVRAGLVALSGVGYVDHVCFLPVVDTELLSWVGKWGVAETGGDPVVVAGSPCRQATGLRRRCFLGVTTSNSTDSTSGGVARLSNRMGADAQNPSHGALHAARRIRFPAFIHRHGEVGSAHARRQLRSGPAQLPCGAAPRHPHRLRSRGRDRWDRRWDRRAIGRRQVHSYPCFCVPAHRHSDHHYEENGANKIMTANPALIYRTGAFSSDRPTDISTVCEWMSLLPTQNRSLAIPLPTIRRSRRSRCDAT